MESKSLLHLKLQIAEKTGLLIREQDVGRLREVISARIKHYKLSGPEDYYRMLQAAPEQSEAEWQKLISLITVGESYFFRDKGQFALLKDQILPELIATGKPQRALKIWSAGCATGEEPYSVAILMDELLPQRQGWQIQILGTDINPDAIDKAKRGIYSKWSFRMCGKDLQANHFTRRQDEWEIKDRVRNMVEFRAGNLLDLSDDLTADFNDVDLIICRNVFIYFNKEAIAQVMARFTRCLREGGYLLTGHGELHGHGLALGALRPQAFEGSVVYQKLGAEALTGLEVPVAARNRQSLPAVISLVPKPRGVAHRPKAPRKIEKPEHKADAASTPEMPSELVARFRGGDYKGAITQGESILAVAPHNFAILHLLAQAYANVGEHHKAAGLCKKMLDLQTHAAKPYFLLAQIAEAQGDYQEAKKLLKKVIYLDHTFVAAYLELSGLYERENDRKRAGTMRQSALTLLKGLAPDQIVEPYREITAEELVRYLREKVA
jgi:chemotaxis protein methyltransferase CheR